MMPHLAHQSAKLGSLLGAILLVSSCSYLPFIGNDQASSVSDQDSRQYGYVPNTITERNNSGFHIDRVKIDQLSDINVRSARTNPSVAFNERRRFHGAISSEERRARLGRYYSINWIAPDDYNAPVTVRFNYRQIKTGEQVMALESQVLSADDSEFSEFAIIGDNWTEGGVVTSWQVQLFDQNNQLLAENNSFLWD